MSLGNGQEQTDRWRNNQPLWTTRGRNISNICRVLNNRILVASRYEGPIGMFVGLHSGGR